MPDSQRRNGLLVRVPTGEPAMVRKLPDAGVRNVFLARPEGAEEVRGSGRG